MHCQTKENTLALLNEKHYSLLQNTISYFLTWQRRKAQSRVHTTETFYVMSILSRIQCYSRNVGFCHSVLLQRSDSSSNKGLQDLKSEMGLGSKFYRCDKKASHYFILFKICLYFFFFSLPEFSWICCQTQLDNRLHDQAVISFMTYIYLVLATCVFVCPHYREYYLNTDIRVFCDSRWIWIWEVWNWWSLLKVSKKKNSRPSSKTFLCMH